MLPEGKSTRSSHSGQAEPMIISMILERHLVFDMRNARMQGVVGEEGLSLQIQTAAYLHFDIYKIHSRKYTSGKAE